MVVPPPPPPPPPPIDSSSSSPSSLLLLAHDRAGEQVPTTLFGRLIALLSATFGILCASLTTATLGNLILFTPAEFSAIAIMEREKARGDLRVIAANMSLLLLLLLVLLPLPVSYTHLTLPTICSV
eukprot:33503-Hanusia_phi.AAC.2